MAEIRKRFAVKLAAKIEETESILADLAGASALEAAKATYQRFHEMAGIAPTIGFVETGNAARALDAILIGPYRAGRALTPDELIKVRAGLETLRAAAGAEMKSLAAECLP
jgi:hypothetical protein